MYDVIVIGARCAGASTAMLLARKGYRVLMIDRARFPSDIAHGHFIHQQGPGRLKRWGLLDRITASNCPPIDSAVYSFGELRLQSAAASLDGLGLGYAPRRKVLDQILIDAAVEAGAELRQSCAVEDFLFDGDRVVGIRARDAGGTVFTEGARVTVGADGRGSKLAKAVQAPAYDDVPTLTCYAFSYWSGVAHGNGVHVYVSPDRAFFAMPTNDGLFTVFCTAPIAEAAAMKANMEAHFLASLERAPQLAELLRAGRREERFYGAADLPNFFRKPYGPGWALVGDAGCHKDPYLALGIHDALRDAELLSDALDEAFGRRAELCDALAAYETKRNESSMRAYRDNLDRARFLPPPPEMAQLFAALRANPEGTRHFFRAHFGLLPRESFFNRENMQRVLQSAGG